MSKLPVNVQTLWTSLQGNISAELIDLCAFQVSGSSEMFPHMKTRGLLPLVHLPLFPVVVLAGF